MSEDARQSVLMILGAVAVGVPLYLGYRLVVAWIIGGALGALAGDGESTSHD